MPNKTYDGGVAATLSSETLAGVISGDSVSASGGAATFASKDVGNGKTVTLNGESPKRRKGLRRLCSPPIQPRQRRPT